MLNRYDNEFIGFLNEIGKRLIFFNFKDVSKIKSWIKLLSFPFESIEEKQNRNLYTIKLLNQMINKKIKYPFSNYANAQKLLPLSPYEVKNGLSNKFFSQINMQSINNYGLKKQKQLMALTSSSIQNNYNDFEINLNELQIIISNLENIIIETDKIIEYQNNEIYKLNNIYNCLIKNQKKEKKSQE